jgi:hypothetical protein
MKTAVDTWLALILLASAGAKLWRRSAAAAGLASYGVSGPQMQHVVLGVLVSVELALAASLAGTAAWALPAAAALFGLFAVATLAALLAGRRDQPCVCFGVGSRLSSWTLLRALLLALLAVAVDRWLPEAPAGAVRWLTAGLALCIGAVVALAIALLALAREVGVLRLGIGSRGALEIADEGPALGTPQSWALMLPWDRSTRLGLAIFTSEGCPLCRQLAPAVRHIGGDPLLAVRSFDEAADVGVWRAAAVPGSPYAVAVDVEGVAWAKGTFNSLPQLESIIATARARSQERARRGEEGARDQEGKRREEAALVR